MWAEQGLADTWSVVLRHLNIIDSDWSWERSVKQEMLVEYLYLVKLRHNRVRVVCEVGKKEILEKS